MHLKKTFIENRVGFDFYNLKELDNALLEKSYKNIYQRFSNPTIVECENAINSLENSKWSILTPSGMSAIDISISSLILKNDNISICFFTDIYSGTKSYVTEILQKRKNISICFLDKNIYNNLIILERKFDILKPKLLFFEIITNPESLFIHNYIHIIRLAKRKGITVIIDNTMGTPLLFQPLLYGADIVIHSATKFFSGSNNLLAGVISGNNFEYKSIIGRYRQLTGIIISPKTANMLQMQLHNLHNRFKKQCKNASKIAKFLKESKKVSCINYPGILYENQKVKIEPIGSILTFWLNSNTRASYQMLLNDRDIFIQNLLPPISCSTSLGAINTTIIHIGVLDKNLSKEKGIGLRLSVGTENIEELLMSLKNGLKFLK